MRALVTGASGFVGGHLVDFLLANTDWHVYAAVHDGDGAWQRGPRDGRVQALPGDLRKITHTRQLMAATRPERVYHLAARTFVPESWQRPWEVLRTNIKAQLNILRALEEATTRARVLVVSSSQVHGDVGGIIGEEAPLRPDSPYAASKIAQEMLAVLYHRRAHLHVVRARPFNQIGPRQDERFVAASFARQIARGEAGLAPRVIKVGDLSAVRDFTDVRDMVRAHWLALEHGVPGEVYNIGSGVGRSVRLLLEGLLGLSRTQFEVQPVSELVRPPDPPHVCDSTRFRRLTGWSPAIEFGQTLADILDDWRGRVRAEQTAGVDD
jgi:GDP-4-dehydro-6-deoxy-D-mannose reductase